jgi:hypothetical protein
MFKPYKPSYGGEYWYLVKGNSTVCYKDTATDKVIASKDRADIQRIADTLNKKG